MEDNCYIQIGEQRQPGLQVAAMLQGVRDRQAITICFAGCPEQDQRVILAIYDKWRQDGRQGNKYKPLLYVALGLAVVLVAYFGGFLDKFLHPETSGAAASGDDFFANQASLHTFIGTIAAILALGVIFVRRLAAKAAREHSGGLKVKDTELSRRLSQGYHLELGDGLLHMTPRAD